MKLKKNWQNNQEKNTPKRKLWMLVSACLMFAATGAGCTIPVSWGEPSSEATSTQLLTDVWQSVEPGVDRLDQRVGAEGVAARVILWRIHPEAKLTWSLALATSTGQTVSAWANQFTEAKIVLNGSYFQANGRPIGWLKAEGSLVTDRVLDKDRAGFVSLGARPALLIGAVPTSTFSGVENVFQSYPWLIRDEKIAFTQETQQYARRTFLGTDAEGRWYVGVVPNESISLFQLAHMLQEMPVHWQRVLNLDGGPSTGVVTRFSGGEDRIDSFSSVAYVLVGR
jgi:hypothetical protein